MTHLPGGSFTEQSTPTNVRVGVASPFLKVVDLVKNAQSLEDARDDELLRSIGVSCGSLLQSQANSFSEASSSGVRFNVYPPTVRSIV